MIKYLLVEDERFAYEEMKRMMEKLRPEYQLEAWTATVEQTVQFLKHHPVDLILLDIRLTDGNSFDIFEQIQVTTPVIFTTAYDEHAIQAFKVNSIDYLLKPVEEADLQAALNKFERLRTAQLPVPDYKQLEGALMSNCKKNRFLIQKGDTYHYVETSDIAFFYSEDKVVFLHTFSDKRYIVDYTLEQIEQLLDERSFFRASRNCIANINSIRKISKYFNSRLKLSLIEIFFYQQSQMEAEKKLAIIEKEKLRYQYETLKAQINPHFLFNSLNVLSSLAYSDAEKTNLFAKKLSSVYRYLLLVNDRPLVTLKEELAFLESYVFLEKIRFEDTLFVEVGEHILYGNRQIIPVSLQLLVENAIKHNIATQKNPLVIRIEVADDGILVSNNLQLRNSVDKGGVGLKNLRKQYVLNNKEIEIMETDTEFMVRLPFIDDK